MFFSLFCQWLIDEHKGFLILSAKAKGKGRGLGRAPFLSPDTGNS
jgi:hypothetical protein